MTETSQNYVYGSWIVELVFATAFIIGGGVCLAIGLGSLEHLLEIWAKSPSRAVQSEVGIFVFGGTALLVAGVAVYLVAPTGFRVDPDNRVIHTWRGLFPRFRMREHPLEGSRLEMQRDVYTSSNGSRRVVYRLVLRRTDGEEMILASESEAGDLEPRAQDLRVRFDVPLDMLDE